MGRGRRHFAAARSHPGASPNDPVNQCLSNKASQTKRPATADAVTGRFQA